MYVNQEGKYTESAKYFYNDYTDAFCVVGTTLSASAICDLEQLFASADLLEEIEMPEYITEDYNGTEW